MTAYFILSLVASVVGLIMVDFFSKTFRRTAAGTIKEKVCLALCIIGSIAFIGGCFGMVIAFM